MYGDVQWGVPGYTEVRELGTGATGRVVLARRDHDGAEVAIKYLSDELKDDVGFVARFRHEARLLGTIRSPHNTRLIDYVETGYGAAIIMELVNGVSLRELLRSEGPTGPEAALAVLKGSLKGLAAAHAIGVVHRDFKPENVIVQADGASKLVDFGIAVTAGEGTNAAGTPPYMAPEQWAGGSAAPATDVYAATVVFFECLTGARPFRASNIAALARQHHATPPPVDEVPAPLRGLVERGLAKHAPDRPPSAEAFLTELEAVAAEAYGEDWEERGRRRLAALAGLLLLLFPNAPQVSVQAQTTLAHTRFPEPSKILGKISAKVAISAACAGVVIAVAVVLINTLDDTPALRAQTTQATPSRPATAIEPPATTLGETDPPEEDPAPSAEEPTPAPTTPTSAAQPVADPPTTAPAPATSPAVRTPTPKPTRTRVRTSGPSPTESPDPELTGRSGVDNDGTAAPTTAATTPPPTTRAPATPTSRPTTTRTTSPPPTPTPTPTDDGGGDGGDGGDGGEPGEPSQTSEPETTPTIGSAGAAMLALGLVTSGAVPVTLAVKRRMAGRHRRKR